MQVPSHGSRVKARSILKFSSWPVSRSSLRQAVHVAGHCVEFSLQEALKQQKNYNMCLSKSEELESMIQQWQDLDICGRTLLDEAKSTIKEAPLVVGLRV